MSVPLFPIVILAPLVIRPPCVILNRSKAEMKDPKVMLINMVGDQHDPGILPSSG
jgi:hypothetical protein